MSGGESRWLHAEGIGHRFAESPLLFSDLDFRMRPGEVHALVGPSGSGKSTLLSILAGWMQPSVGRLRRNGIDSVSWVFQNPLGVAGRSALDHVALPLLARGLTHSAARARARTYLAMVGLAKLGPFPFKTLSGGEAQRLMLARSVASSPDLLLVDEPTAQLDARTADGVNEAIAGMADQGSIVVVATHDPRTRDACTNVIPLVPGV